jgi:hypothetical protein
VLDGEKFGMEVSCPEAPWPCACPNIAPAQSRPAKIVLAALQLLIGGNTVVDAALAFDELLQRLRIQLVLVRVAHQSRPLASRSLVHLGGVGGADVEVGEAGAVRGVKQLGRLCQSDQDIGLRPAAMGRGENEKGQ